MDNVNLTLGSLFDGSGGFPLAGLLAGITPLWASEIEPFPIRVTTKRLPFVKHLGDISLVDGAEADPVDIVTFGSPCTDMSVAGKRAGLDGKQSCLFYQAIRIIKEMRCATDGRYPRFIVWENVPGAFSSNKEEDFRAVLEAVCSVKGGEVPVPMPPRGKWANAGNIVGNGFSLAWRVLDAQFWGVPQRRKRIYLVADFAGRRAGKILFESEGVSGYSAEGFRAWQGAARDTPACTGKAGGICLNDQGGQKMDVTDNITCTLRAESHHPPCVLELAGNPMQSQGAGNGSTLMAINAETPKTLKIRSGCEGGGKGILIQEDKSATLSCNNDQAVFVPSGKTHPVRTFGICSKESNAMKSDNPRSGFYEAETSRTLDANGGNPSCNQGGIAVVEPEGMSAFHINQRDEVIDLHGKSGALMATRNMQMQTFVLQGSMIGRDDGNRPQGSGINEDVAFSLTAADRHAVAQPTYCTSKNSHFTRAEKELANTLVATDYKDPPVINDVRAEPDYIVRRLTPTECARLQGFPDWWCGGLGTEDPTEGELAFWREVFETHRKIMGTSKKPKTDRQILKWLKDPHSDSAEYRMWGNGIALPNAYFVLAGIVYYAQFPDFLL